MRPILPSVAAVACCLSGWLRAYGGDSATDVRASVQGIVAQAVQPLMEQYGVPGMAVGVVRDGRSEVFCYGVASRATGKPVEANTLFEIGSLSKTFTATLAAYGQVVGRLRLQEPASQFFPALRGSRFDAVTLIQLGTHTAGGLPLQVPDNVTNEDQLLQYFQGWKPTYAPGTERVYSNVSIGLLGLVTAKSLDGEFVALMEGKLFPALGLKSTYLDVPATEVGRYAQGYTEKDVPIRLAPGMLDAEAYGVRTTAGDLLHFIEANLGTLALDARWQRAVADTHTGYYQTGAMTQDLIWEQYHYPVGLKELLAGNSAKVILEANPVVKIDPPLPPQAEVFINKTGSTNGFGAYAAFVPARKMGVVLLANKRYPIEARVTAAHEILARLTEGATAR